VKREKVIKNDDDELPVDALALLGRMARATTR
jgi:hypothetical protein